MGQVTIDISVSIDGFIASPDDSSGPIHDWYFDGDVENEQNPFFLTSPESAPVIVENLTRAAAVICGRRTYDLTNGWDGNHPLGEVTCFVVTHDPPKRGAGRSNVVRIRHRRHRARDSTGRSQQPATATSTSWVVRVSYGRPCRRNVSTGSISIWHMC